LGVLYGDKGIPMEKFNGEQVSSPSRVEDRLPGEMRVAQEAINLPRVQQIMEELSQYNLGICIPHIHQDVTGDFAPLPDGVVQV
jgi:hypothetical protein